MVDSVNDRSPSVHGLPRRAGVLAHVSSLPSPHLIGDLGPAAHRFADFLSEAGAGVWQVLPFVPTSPSLGNSPYSSVSAFAANPLLISPEGLFERGLIPRSALPAAHPVGRADHESAQALRVPLLSLAWREFCSSRGVRSEPFARFCDENRDWLDDYCLYRLLKDSAGGRPWWEWDPSLRDRSPEALGEIARTQADALGRIRFAQFLFQEQWEDLKGHCRARGIHVVGDIPIYVDLDSADVWANRDLFDLEADGRPNLVAGVPPDAFSSTGQLWGNPLFRWDAQREACFRWWLRRVRRNLRLFDEVRLDHFIGFARYWAVHAGARDARGGRYLPGPGIELFRFLQEGLGTGPLPFLVEDLGIMGPDVEALRDRLSLPGMKVLLFAFGGEFAKNPYAPHNHVPRCWVYTGTHDNNTVRGWFSRDATEVERANLRACLGYLPGEDEVAEAFMRMAFASVAMTAVVPLPDVLNLGGEARMNFPGIAKGNWEWRCPEELLTPEIARRFRSMAQLFGRSPPTP